MPYQKYLIGPYKSGLIDGVKPFYLPEDAFFKMLNVYTWRGRIRKRPGEITVSNTGTAIQKTNKSRLRINLGNTTAGGNFNNSGNPVPGMVWKIGQAFSIGDEFFTVYQANGAMLTTGGATTHNFDTATGMVNIVAAAATTAVYYYPAEPVMGFFNPEQEMVNDEPTWAWDTQFAYEFNVANDGWERLAGEAMAGDALWDSTINNNSAFFWAHSYDGINDFQSFHYVTNNNPAEPRKMRYYNTATNQWNQFRPNFAYAPPPQIPIPPLHIEAALMIISFADTLVLLNTYEEVTPGVVEHFPSRIRWCKQNFSPIDNTVLNIYPFNLREAGFGGFLFGPTQEAIVSAKKLRDRLIVYFERSTYELARLGQNSVIPFEWRKINTELGAESTFSFIPFDKAVLGVGNTGVHACSGTNVERIDSKIPDEVFKIHNDIEGVKRVHGIRDYFTEMAYWTFPNFVDNPTYPTRILALNYTEESWSLWSDSITAWGYFQNPASRATPPTNLSDQSKFRQVVAGNQQGYTFLMDREIPQNTAALQITQIDISGDPTVILTIIDNNLDTTSADPDDTDFVLLDNIQGITGLNGNIYAIETPTANTINITARGAIAGVYTGGGTVQRVSRINMLTKDFNPFTPEGRNGFINKINFLIDRVPTVLPPTPDPVIEVDYYISTAPISVVDQATTSLSLIGTSNLQLSSYTLIPYEALQQQMWHTVYFQAEGSFIQFNIFYNDDQMIQNDTSLKDFQLHSMILSAMPTSEYNG